MPTLAGFAWLPALVLVIAAAASFVKVRARRRLLERQRGVESIRALSWREFEQLVGEGLARLDACVVCGSPVVERVAGRGAMAGQRFLGCSRYPTCRATRPL